MTEESKSSSSTSGSGVPGSGAGDSAPTQAIPRIPKPTDAAGKKPPAPTKGSPATKPAGTNGSSQTDKGRPRQSPPVAKAPAGKTAGNPAGNPAAQQGGQPGAQAASAKSAAGTAGTAKDRPLTAADYARTTQQSAASTAVIPAVKDGSGKGPGPASGKGKGTGPESTARTAATPAAAASSGRRASLHLTHVEPWSVTRLAFAISVAMMIVAVVAATIFWIVLELAGVWGQINDSFTSVLSDDSSSFDVKDYFGFWRVFGLTLVLSAINVVITTALATIGAHLYNLAAQLMGGVEVTFTEER